MKQVFLMACFAAMACWANAADKVVSIQSPDGKVNVDVTVGKDLAYCVSVDGQMVLANSKLAMNLADGKVWGRDCKLKGKKVTKINQTIESPLTHQATMADQCTELTLSFAQYQVLFRAYDNGVAYRFVSTRKGDYQVKHETVEYNFTADQTVITPYVNGANVKHPSFHEQFFNSFENTYTTTSLSKLDAKALSFLPVVVNVGDGKRLCITESHLEDYPGLYLLAGQGNQLVGVNAPYPKKMHQGGHNNLQMLVDEREDYIAKVSGPRPFPWRIAMISRKDADLAENNLSYLLAAPSRLDDISWVKPGKVAWDWWNDWNIKNVDFVAGINNDTYKYYIDFASEQGIEYVILDEGWAVNLKADLMQVVPEIDLDMLVKYAGQRHVGIILWAGYRAFDRDMEQVCKHYAAMGVKGFKIDFMDRDDQIVADFYYRAAATCAKYKLMADFHGAFKPSGLNRTYPNVINFEGVSGLENMKWASTSRDQVKYDCEIPFIRQAAGPMDYTQGAMRNAAKGHYYPCGSEPMSQGTRCHQLGLYVVLASPLNMLCDSPSNYLDNMECTRVIATVPTVWDETRVLAGEIGQYVVTARRKGDVWYIGGITNWEARDVTFSLPEGMAGTKACLFSDGANAHRRGDDYRCTELTLQPSMTIHMAPGGGFILSSSSGFSPR